VKNDEALSGPTFPVSVSIDGIFIGKVECVSDIIWLYKQAKALKWGGDLILLDADARPVLMVRGIPFVKA